ncbi:MAG: hypothetical protein R2681_12395 [Pyrinomonadaceae bacterium]
MFPAARFIGCHLEMFSETTGERSVWRYGSDFAVENEEIVEIPGGEVSFVHELNSNPFHWYNSQTSCVILHREVVQKVGGFDEDIAYCDELEFFCRIMRHFPITMMKKSLVIYREHDKNHSLEKENVEKNLLKMADMMLKEPDKYPPNAGNFWRKILLENFLRKGSRLAGELKNG